MCFSAVLALLFPHGNDNISIPLALLSSPYSVFSISMPAHCNLIVVLSVAHSPIRSWVPFCVLCSLAVFYFYAAVSSYCVVLSVFSHPLSNFCWPMYFFVPDFFGFSSVPASCVLFPSFSDIPLCALRASLLPLAIFFAAAFFTFLPHYLK